MDRVEEVEGSEQLVLDDIQVKRHSSIFQICIVYSVCDVYNSKYNILLFILNSIITV